MTGQRQLLTSQSQKIQDNHICDKTISRSSLFCGRAGHLQGQDQSDQVHQNLVIGQFNAENSQQGDESLVMALPTAFLLTCQVDMPVETLSMLHIQKLIHLSWTDSDEE